MDAYRKELVKAMEMEESPEELGALGMSGSVDTFHSRE
jgi:hypothetical protein